MNIENMKRIVAESVDGQVSILSEIIEIYTHTNIEALQNIFLKKPTVAHNVVLNMLMIYSLVGFKEDEKELSNARQYLSKSIEEEPVVKDLIDIYMQVVTIDDINPHLTNSQVSEKTQRLKTILNY